MNPKNKRSKVPKKGFLCQHIPSCLMFKNWGENLYVTFEINRMAKNFFFFFLISIKNMNMQIKCIYYT